MSNRGGTADTQVDVNRVVAKNMLGDEAKKVAKELGVRDRQGLPTEAKEALFVGDVAARNQIVQDNAQGHEAIVNSADRGTKKARRLFGW